jgi:hypothetical protein
LPAVAARGEGRRPGDDGRALQGWRRHRRKRGSHGADSRRQAKREVCEGVRVTRRVPGEPNVWAAEL